MPFPHCSLPKQQKKKSTPEHHTSHRSFPALVRPRLNHHHCSLPSDVGFLALPPCHLAQGRDHHRFQAAFLGLAHHAPVPK